MKKTTADLPNGGGWTRMRGEPPVAAKTTKRCTNPLLEERDLVPHGASGKAEKIDRIATARMSATMKSTGPTEDVGVENDIVHVAKDQDVTIKALMTSSTETILNEKLRDQGHHDVTGETTRNDLTEEEVYHHNRPEDRELDLPNDHPARKQMSMQRPKLRNSPPPPVMTPIPSKSL
jgi:hypothetical protein